MLILAVAETLGTLERALQRTDGPAHKSVETGAQSLAIRLLGATTLHRRRIPLARRRGPGESLHDGRRGAAATASISAISISNLRRQPSHSPGPGAVRHILSGVRARRSWTTLPHSGGDNPLYLRIKSDSERPDHHPPRRTDRGSAALPAASACRHARRLVEKAGGHFHHRSTQPGRGFYVTSLAAVFLCFGLVTPRLCHPVLPSLPLAVFSFAPPLTTDFCLPFSPPSTPYSCSPLLPFPQLPIAYRLRSGLWRRSPSRMAVRPHSVDVLLLVSFRTHYCMPPARTGLEVLTWPLRLLQFSAHSYTHPTSN